MMPRGLSLLVLLKRDFWGLFGAIWLLAGIVFLVIGIPIAVSKGESEGYVFAWNSTCVVKASPQRAK